MYRASVGEGSVAQLKLGEGSFLSTVLTSRRERCLVLLNVVLLWAGRDEGGSIVRLDCWKERYQRMELIRKQRYTGIGLMLQGYLLRHYLSSLPVRKPKKTAQIYNRRVKWEQPLLDLKK